MAQATVTAPVAGAHFPNRAIRRAALYFTWGGIVFLAFTFVAKYVLFYYRHYDAASFDPYWPRRGWLFLHINGGTLAVLTGPFQFSSRIRQRNLALHRWTGRIFLLGVGAGIVGTIGLSLTSTFGWALVYGVRGLALAWLVTAGMGYYTILQGLVSLHREWMIRAYVVTFAFVTFRLLQDYGPVSHLRPENDRDITIAWACWVVPLAITEMAFHLKRVRTELARKQSSQENAP